MEFNSNYEQDKLFFEELNCFNISRSGRRMSCNGLVYHIPTGIWRYHGIKVEINNSNDIKRILGID